MIKARRTISIILLLLVFAASLDVPVLAESIMTMPASIQIIGEEAFFGDDSLENVVLPEGTKEIHANAFADSSLSEINLPDSLTFIDDNAFDGPDEVTVKANEGTYAYDWAVENGYIRPAQSVSISETTAVMQVGDIISLAATVVPSDTTDEVAWSASDPNVLNVDDQGNVLAIAVGNATVTVSAGHSSASCSISVSSRLQQLTINSIETSRNEAVTVGDAITWFADISGAEGVVSYSYTLIYNGEAIAQTNDTPFNTYQTIADKAGTYTLQVTCHDDINTASLESDPVVAGFAPLTIDCAISKDTNIFVGDSIRVTAIAGENDISTYSYELVNADSSLVESAQESISPYANIVLPNAGNYYIRIVAETVDGRTAETTTLPFEVQNTTSLPAPVLLFTEESLQMGLTQEEAPLYKNNEGILLNWASVIDANCYKITLEVELENDWLRVFDTTTKDLTYTIDEAVFAEITEVTSYRISISSIGERNGLTNVYYFRMSDYELDKSILVSGQSSLTWNQASNAESSRTFQITSELPWTAEASVDWVVLDKTEDSLYVTITENTSVFEDRNATITVTNEINTCIITINQGWNTDVPTLEYPLLSQDPELPTTISTGKQYFICDKKAVIVLSAFDGEDYTRVFESNQSRYIYIGTTSQDYQLEDNKKYRLDVLYVYDSNYRINEVESDMLRSTYYFIAHSDASYVYVNGTTSSELTMTTDTVYAYVHASGIVDYTTDVDWLHVETYNVNLYNNQNRRIKVYADNYNLTTNDRIGHIYITCGDSIAEIIVTQRGVAPGLIFPMDLSEDENNPTIIQYGYFQYTGLCEQLYLYELVDGEYSIISLRSSYATSSEPETLTACITKDDLKPNTKYRIMVETNNTIKYYYIKTESKSGTGTVLLDNDQYPLELEFGVSAQSQEITIKGSNSWRASSNAAWLTCSSTSGSTSSKTVTVRATENTDGVERTAYIIIEGKTAYTSYYPVNYIKVTQSGESESSIEYLTVSNYGNNGYRLLQQADLLNLDSSKQNRQLLIMASGQTSATSDSTWITLSSSTVEPGKTLKITVLANTTGILRTGFVTLQCGSMTQTIPVSQVPALPTPALLSPNLSNDYHNPSVYSLENNDLTLTWNDVEGAVSYEIGIDNGKVVNRVRINADGSDSYSFIVPTSWLIFDESQMNDVPSVELHAYDIYGYSSFAYWYFYPQAGDGVYINGERAPLWDNVTDLNVTSDTFTVMSTREWTASVDSSWITISKNSGSNGDSFTVALEQNLGDSRTGYVEVTCGNATSYLTINQCSAIPEYPALILPELSDLQDEPTILPANTTQITVKWSVEPQAEDYILRLSYFTRENVRRIFKTVSGKDLKTDGQFQGTYTFSNLSLEVGKLYSLTITRSNNGRHNAHIYYFMLDDGQSYITFENESENETLLTGDEGGHYLRINSSGVWSASSNANWLAIGRTYIDEDYLTEVGESIEDNMKYHGNPGDTLYYCASPNLTGASRTATITVKSGLATAVFTVTQEKQYTISELTSPSISTARQEPSKRNAEDISLSWNSAVGGTGRYALYIEEFEDSNYRGGDRVFKKEGITSCFYNIPASTFVEGKYYKLSLGTEVDDGDGYYINSYYFRVTYTNALSVSLTTSGTGKVGDGVTIRADATASGGSGTGYKYAFYLLQGDEVVGLSDGWNSFSYWTFSVKEAGEYHVEVIVKDSSGDTVTQSSNTISATEHTEDFVLINSAEAVTREISNIGGSTIVAIRALTNWSATSDVDWLTLDWSGAKESSMTVYAPANPLPVAREGHVTVTCGSASATLTIKQNGEGTISASVNDLTFTAAAGSREVAISSSLSWRATKSDSWIRIDPSSTTDASTLRISVAANTSYSSRTGSVTVTAGAVTTTIGVSQAGSAVSSDGIKKVQMPYTTETGELTTMIVNVQNATYVRMTIDGKYVTDPFIVDPSYNAAIIRYEFSASGARELTFSALVNGVWIDNPTKYTLNVTAPYGTLDSPIIATIGKTVEKGQAVTISWTDSGNATSYNVYVYKDGELFKKYTKQTTNTITLTEDDLSLAGNYRITVMSAARGYDQGEANDSFTVQWQGYLHQKKASLYESEDMNRAATRIRFGTQYTITKEKIINNVVVAEICENGRILGYADASLFGTEYWHPCLKNGVYVHTWIETYQLAHPHALYYICTECEAEKKLAPEEQRYAPNSSPMISNCCLCGNHTYTVTYMAPHPHYAEKRCRCGDFVIDQNTVQINYPGCCLCNGHSYSNGRCINCRAAEEVSINIDSPVTYDASGLKNMVDIIPFPGQLIALYNDVYDDLGTVDGYIIATEHPIKATIYSAGYLMGIPQPFDDLYNSYYEDAASSALYYLTGAQRTEAAATLATLKKWRNLFVGVDIGSNIWSAYAASTDFSKTGTLTFREFIGTDTYNSIPDGPLKRILSSQTICFNKDGLRELVDLSGPDGHEFAEAISGSAVKFIDALIINTYRIAALNNLSDSLEELINSLDSNSQYGSILQNVLKDIKADTRLLNEGVEITIDATSTLTNPSIGCVLKSLTDKPGDALLEFSEDFLTEVWLPAKVGKYTWKSAVAVADLMMKTNDTAMAMRRFVMCMCVLDQAYQNMRNVADRTPEFATTAQLADLYVAINTYLNLAHNVANAGFDLINTLNSNNFKCWSNGGPATYTLWIESLTSVKTIATESIGYTYDRLYAVCPEAITSPY